MSYIIRVMCGFKRMLRVSMPDSIPEVMAICRNAILNLLRTWGYTSLKLARECFALNPSKALGLLELPVSFPLK